MNPATVLVVGDEFAEFAELNGAISASAFAHQLDGASLGEELPRHVLVGQGVSEGWLQYLRQRVADRCLDIEFHNTRQVEQRTGRRFAHKRSRKNILITDPVQAGPNHFHCLLAIDDDCEIMSDHTTGCHLQGMLLIEAARQTFLAVTERYLLDNSVPHCFVINGMDVSYRKFAFPIATDIRFDIAELDRSRQDRLSVKAVVSVLQAGDCVCEVSVDYSAVQRERLMLRERQMAQQVLGLAIKALAKPANGEAQAA